MTLWHSVHSNLEFGLSWNESQTATTFSIAPVVYRWDRYNTDNYAGRFDDALSPDPSGAGWWGDMPFGSGSGTRAIDTFATRTYEKGHSEQDIRLELSWNASTGTWVSGVGFVVTGSGYTNWHITVPALASYKVAYNANGGGGAPSAQTKWYGEVLTLSSTKPTRAGYTFQGWSTSSTGAVKYAAGARYEANSAVTLYAVWKVVAPAAPTNCVNTRNSDAKNTVSWKLGANAAVTYASIEVHRSVDGGAWSKAATVAKSATSWADATCSANHSYRYRVRAVNATGASAYATSGTTYNTPAAPTKLTPSRTGETSVKVDIVNPAKTATALELQRSADGSAWSNSVSLGGTVTTLTDNPGGGTWVYRARNTRGALASAWSPVSAPVVTMCAPAAPTLVEPTRGQVVDSSTPKIAFAWRHNPLDGSSQTAAEVRYSTDGGGTWQTVEATTEQTATIVNAFEVNADVTWSVRTKGAHADFGPWSGNGVFSVKQAPSVAFAKPADGFVIENTPVAVELQYSDASGEYAGGVLTIERGGVVERTFDMTEKTLEIPVGEWLPQDGAAYAFRVSARSTSTLTASAMREVTVDFVLPQAADLVIEPDPETGRVQIVCNLAEADGRVPAVSITLRRVSKDGSVLLGDGLPEGAGVTDAYAPLNSDYAYEATTTADSGAACTVSFHARVDTEWAFMCFGGDLARGRWNPTHSFGLTPSVEYVRYAGLKRPVAYMEDYNEESHSVSFVLQTMEEADAFKRMMAACEPVVAKLPSGEVLRAVPKVSAIENLGTRCLYGEVSVDLTVVDGDAL